MEKYLFFDIDGTLTGRSQRITERNKRALTRARENGHKIFLCTGRAYRSALRRSDFDAVRKVLSCVNTAVVYIQAPEELKKYAKAFFNDPDQDGICEALEQLKLI